MKKTGLFEKERVYIFLSLSLAMVAIGYLDSIGRVHLADMARNLLTVVTTFVMTFAMGRIVSVDREAEKAV